MKNIQKELDKLYKEIEKCNGVQTVQMYAKIAELKKQL